MKSKPSVGLTWQVIDIGDERRSARQLQPGNCCGSPVNARRSGSQPIHMTDPIYRVIEIPEGNTPAE
jgi:hypothetical protein